MTRLPFLAFVLLPILAAAPAAAAETAPPPPSVATSPASPGPEKSPSAAPSAKLDLNTATLEQLQALPGLAPMAAQRIVLGRPYTSLADLDRARIPLPMLQRILPLVTVSGAPPNEPPPLLRPLRVPDPPVHVEHPLNLNTASAKEIAQLPGLAGERAEAIIANRPYQYLGDLRRAGLPISAIAELRGRVTFRADGTPAGTETDAPPRPRREPRLTRPGASPAPPRLEAPAAAPTASPSPSPSPTPDPPPARTGTRGPR